MTTALLAKRRRHAVASGALLGSLSVLDALFPLGQLVQLAALAVGLYLVRSSLRSALSNERNIAAISVIYGLLVLGLAIGLNNRAALPELSYAISVLVLLPIWVMLGLGLALSRPVLRSFLDGILLAAIGAAALQLADQLDSAVHIEAGRVIAVGVPIALFRSYPQHHRLRSMAIRAVTASFLIWAALTTGARGPLAAAVISSLIVALATLPMALPAQRVRRVSILLSTLVALWLTLRTDLLRLDGGSPEIRRQQQLIGAESLSDIPSGEDRIQNYYLPAVERIREDWLLGSGLPADLDQETSFASYPHNIALELAMIWGIIGLLIGLFLIVVVGTNISRVISEPVLAGVLVYAIFAALVSADLPSNRLVFFAIAAVAALPKTNLPRRPAFLGRRSVSTI